MTTDILARQLKAAREARGHSQDLVARDFDVCTKTVSRWETGRNRPGVDMLQRLARYYGVTLTWLVSGREERPLPVKRARVARVA